MRSPGLFSGRYPPCSPERLGKGLSRQTLGAGARGGVREVTGPGGGMVYPGQKRRPATPRAGHTPSHIKPPLETPPRTATAETDPRSIAGQTRGGQKGGRTRLFPNSTSVAPRRGGAPSQRFSL